MTQLRYHNYLRPLDSFDENWRLLGILGPGVYRGWDTISTVSGNDLTVGHAGDGIAKTLEDITAVSAPMGIAVTPQGTIVTEDAGITLSVDYNSGGANDRIDIVVIDHEYVASSGGAAASYILVKGAADGSEPSIPNAKRQAKLGRFIIPAGATNHNDTVWQRAEIPGSGGRPVYQKQGESDNIVIPNVTLLNDFNKVTRAGVYVLDNIPLNSPVSTEKWLVYVGSYGNLKTQLAQSFDTGVLWTRYYDSSSWSTWERVGSGDLPGFTARNLDNASPIIELTVGVSTMYQKINPTSITFTAAHYIDLKLTNAKAGNQFFLLLEADVDGNTWKVIQDGDVGQVVFDIATVGSNKLNYLVASKNQGLMLRCVFNGTGWEAFPVTTRDAFVHDQVTPTLLNSWAGNLYLERDGKICRLQGLIQGLSSTDAKVCDIPSTHWGRFSVLAHDATYTNEPIVLFMQPIIGELRAFNLDMTAVSGNGNVTYYVDTLYESTA